MILYFSGTGNSKKVAEALAIFTTDRAVRIDTTTPQVLQLSEDEPIGLVFPVYGWGLPKAVRAWFALASPLQIKQTSAGLASPYVFAVLTCGDDVGLTDGELQRQLQRHGLSLDAVWSIFMPETYVALPGFNVDTEQQLQHKQAEAQERIRSIAASVNARRRGVADVYHGRFPWTKSRVIGTLFNTFLVNDRRLKRTAACNGCGLCARVCPLGNINLDEEGKPAWRGHCTTCLSCYHHCPRHAITCGAGTARKGQYKPTRFSLLPEK